MIKRIKIETSRILLYADAHWLNSHLTHLFRVRGILDLSNWWTETVYPIEYDQINLIGEGVTSPHPGWDADGAPVEEWPS